MRSKNYVNQNYYYSYRNHFLYLAFNEVGGYESMMDKYRYKSNADPEYAAYFIDDKTGENKSCR